MLYVDQSFRNGKQANNQGLYFYKTSQVLVVPKNINAGSLYA